MFARVSTLPVRANRLAIVPRRLQITTAPYVRPLKSWQHDAQMASYFVGKGIVLFTMFYCTMNWWHYRRLREDEEKKK